MAHIRIPNSLKRILATSLVLILISSFVVIFIGGALSKVNTDIKKLNEFLTNTQEAQPNFEKSLEMYTEKTKDIIEFLLKLRPGTEEQYIEVISKIEKIGQELSLNINLQSMDNPTNEKTIDYRLSFYGSFTNLKDFLTELEYLPYFIKVNNIEYKNPTLLDKKDKTSPNIEIIIKLHVK